MSSVDGPVLDPSGYIALAGNVQALGKGLVLCAGLVLVDLGDRFHLGV